MISVWEVSSIISKTMSPLSTHEPQRLTAGADRILSCTLDYGGGSCGNRHAQASLLTINRSLPIKRRRLRRYNDWTPCGFDTGSRHTIPTSDETR